MAKKNLKLKPKQKLITIVNKGRRRPNKSLVRKSNILDKNTANGETPSTWSLVIHALINVLWYKICAYMCKCMWVCVCVWKCDYAARNCSTVAHPKTTTTRQTCIIDINNVIGVNFHVRFVDKRNATLMKKSSDWH